VPLLSSLHPPSTTLRASFCVPTQERGNEMEVRSQKAKVRS